ncbi:MAG: 30S ribosomal protein S7 [Phycisphaerales bacterium JB052]|nr:30S ribosomal protein S7 [Phycisphaerae bacterium]HCT46612.1 30S ribosomal protein S7 [Phycisphaerales bacterium]|tara:strand:- start:35 stop:535 length:501 start_codon:yes stop_codon:yes gene_type:complete
MAGRITHSEAQLRPDPKFNDKVLSKFINCIMLDGRKTSAQRVVYNALDVIQEKLKGNAEAEAEGITDSIEIFHRAIENVKPYVEVRSKRIGGANYQVPMQVKTNRQQSLAFRWIITAVRSEKGRPTHLKLAEELWAAARGEGKAMTTRDQTHRMAEANKAFAHFAR